MTYSPMSLRLTEDQLTLYQRRIEKARSRLPPRRRHSPAPPDATAAAIASTATAPASQAISLNLSDALSDDHIQRIRLTPVAAPRQTRRDRWKPSKATQRYRTYCDLLRATGAWVPDSGAFVLFALPMPASWPKYKRRALACLAHQSKPDIDNLLKALIDALRGKRGQGADDRVLHRLFAEKYWTADPIGEVLILPLPGDWVSPLSRWWRERKT